MIVADENIEQHWIKLLRDSGFEVLSIRETTPGISDEAVVAIAKEQQGLLLTEDKDFGELVFAHGIRGLSVLFLRYDQPRYEQVHDLLLKAVREYGIQPRHFFITVTPVGIRIRSI